MSECQQPKYMSLSYSQLKGTQETEHVICKLLADCMHRKMPPPFFVAELIAEISEGNVPNLTYAQPQLKEQGDG